MRHGQSTANVAFEAARRQGREDAGIQGRDADVPLSPHGRSQAAALGRWLSSFPEAGRPEVAYVSVYLRARQSLEVLLEASRLPLAGQVEVRLDVALRLRSFLRDLDTWVPLTPRSVVG